MAVAASSEKRGRRGRRARRRAKGLPNWRIVRYADDFVILGHGTRDDVKPRTKRSRSCSLCRDCGCRRPRP